jgi:hypothetical protein
MKILMNAEAFGFGPSAMIAQVFREINDKILQHQYQIDYVGSGHTLDLQRQLPYHAIYDVSEEWLFKALVEQYDCFITALDFEKARWARQMQIEVIIYDNLTWYWRKFPQIIHDCHYIAHQFYGVENRIEKEGLKNYHLVSPFCASSLLKQNNHSNTNSNSNNNNNSNDTHCSNHWQVKNNKIILVNFGGLENPLWTSEVTICYVQALLSIIKTHRDALLALQLKFNFSHYAQYSIETLSRQEVEALLPHVAFALMTPGLGNIIDSAVYGMPVCFLPPANDSQGWQLDILRDKGLVLASGHSDWDCFFDKIDYTQPQKLVLEQIKGYITQLHQMSHIYEYSQHYENSDCFELNKSQTILSRLNQLPDIIEFFQNNMQELAYQANQHNNQHNNYSNDGDNQACMSSLKQLTIDLARGILNASDIMLSILSDIETQAKTKAKNLTPDYQKGLDYSNHGHVHVLCKKKKTRKQKRDDSPDELSIIDFGSAA